MKPSELFNYEDETKELRTLWTEYKAAQKQHMQGRKTRDYNVVQRQKLERRKLRGYKPVKAKLVVHTRKKKSN